MIITTQITNTKFFTFISVLVFMLSSTKALFINRKYNKKKLLKSRLIFFKRIVNFMGKLLLKKLKCELSGYF